uniref:Uncharacterized protein n=1 Tax=Lotharella globosa TaxID=91324 RepID=A0A7S4DEG7_9EUKA
MSSWEAGALTIYGDLKHQCYHPCYAADNRSCVEQLTKPETAPRFSRVSLSAKPGNVERCIREGKKHIEIADEHMAAAQRRKKGAGKKPNVVATFGRKRRKRNRRSLYQKALHLYRLGAEKLKFAIPYLASMEAKDEIEKLIAAAQKEVGQVVKRHIVLGEKHIHAAAGFERVCRDEKALNMYRLAAEELKFGEGF